MKKLLLTSVSILLFILSHGQNLQFSQVVLVTTTQTVPAGKIWKVESYLPTTVKVTSFFPTAFNINVNGTAYPIGHSAFGNVSGNNAEAWSSSMVNTSLPLWLPAGTNVSAGSGIGLLSVVEFTVVP